MLIRLTTPYRRWGFGLCFQYLRNVKGFEWNHKRVLGCGQKLGLLEPARVDPDSGYRFCTLGHLPHIHRILALHEVGIGWLIFKSGYLPRVLGWLIGLAGICYIVNGFANILALGALRRLGSLILLAAFVAELSLALWFLFKGLRLDQWTAKQS